MGIDSFNSNVFLNFLSYERLLQSVFLMQIKGLYKAERKYLLMVVQTHFKIAILITLKAT